LHRFPLTLPFSRRLGNIRRYFERFESTLSKAMEVMRKHDNFARTLGPLDEAGDEIGDPHSYGWSEILMEELRVSFVEYRIFTDLGLTLQELYGYPTPDEEEELPLEISNAKTFTRRLGMSYEELIEILKTRFINPNAALLPKLERLGVSSEAEGAEGKFKHGTGLVHLLPHPLPDASHYGGNRGVGQKRTNFSKISSIITLAGLRCRRRMRLRRAEPATPNE
jgi:hypothetical protein